MTRAAILDQLATHPVRKGVPVRLLIDLSTLKKTGKFWHLSTPTEDIDAPEPWVRLLNGKRGLHLVVLSSSASGESLGAFASGAAKGRRARIIWPVSCWLASPTERSKTRSKVEHIFGTMITSMGGKAIGSIGMANAKVNLGLKNLRFNLQRYVFWQKQELLEAQA